MLLLRSEIVFLLFGLIALGQGSLSLRLLQHPQFCYLEAIFFVVTHVLVCVCYYLVQHNYLLACETRKIKARKKVRIYGVKG